MEHTVVRRRARPLRTPSSSGKALGSKRATPNSATMTAQSIDPSGERDDQLNTKRNGLKAA